MYNVGDTGVLLMAKEKLGYQTWPGPAGLRSNHGIQMTNLATAPCTYCMLYRDLKKLEGSL